MFNTLVFIEQLQPDGTWFRMSSSLRKLDDAIAYLVDTYIDERIPQHLWGTYRFVDAQGISIAA